MSVHRRFILRLGTASVLLLASLLASAIRTVHAQSAPVPAVDTYNRTEVMNLYRDCYLPSSHALPGWTGNVGGGTPGTLNPSFVRAILRRINYFRAMSGVPGNIVFDPVACNHCQETALMMAAQRAVSHPPSRDWKFYTLVVAQTAAHANLHLDWRGNQGPDAIDRYIADPSKRNRAWVTAMVSRTLDETYRVQIDDVYIGGVCRQFVYPVTSMDPSNRAALVRGSAALAGTTRLALADVPSGLAAKH